MRKFGGISPVFAVLAVNPENGTETWNRVSLPSLVSFSCFSYSVLIASYFLVPLRHGFLILFLTIWVDLHWTVPYSNHKVGQNHRILVIFLPFWHQIWIWNSVREKEREGEVFLTVPTFCRAVVLTCSFFMGPDSTGPLTSASPWLPRSCRCWKISGSSSSSASV